MKFIRTVEHLMFHMEQAPKAAKEIGTWIAKGAPIADGVTLKIRKDTCEECEHWRRSPDRCDKCKCLVAKLHLQTSFCPLGKW